jgi:integrase
MTILLVMASLHKDSRGRSPYFYCAFRLPNGKPAFRSTKQTDHKAAMRICIEWEKASEAAGEGSMTEVQARKVLDSILASVGERKIRTPSTQDFFTKWLEGKQISKKAATWRLYKASVSRFLDSLGTRAQRPLASLHVSDIESYRDRRASSGIAAATVKADLKTVRSVLENARRHGLILHNVAEAIDLPVVKSQERDVLTQSEVRTILDAAPTDWKTAILLGYYTGARLSDLVALKWDNVDLAEGVLFFLQGKTAKRVEVPIHPDLERHLFSIAGDNPRGFLTGSLATMSLSGAGGLSQQFGRLIASAGIDQRKVQVSRRRTFSRKSFHSLRHSFTSALAAAGVSPERRMQLTGHRSIDVHERYTHTELEPLRKAIAALPSLGRRNE